MAAAFIFASVPKTGVFDTGRIYTINFDPDPRTASPLAEEDTLDAMLGANQGVALRLKTAGRLWVAFSLPAPWRIIEAQCQ